MQRFMLIAFALLAFAATTARAERTLEHSAVIEAPVAEVWRAFTTADGFASWAVAKAEVDFRIGGEFRTSYNPQSTLRDEYTIVNRILSFDPQRMLSIQNVQAPAGFNNAHLFQQTWSVIYFMPVEGAVHQTHVRILGHGYGKGPEWDEIYTMFKVGNGMVLGALKKKFAANTTADDPDRVLELLGRLVGGEWIHEGTPPGAPNGTVLRVRNVIEHGPDGTSLVMRGWLGGNDGMHPHSAAIVWPEPARTDAPRTIRFININEKGGISRGSIRLVDRDVIEWDWNTTAQNGTPGRHRITMTFGALDQYTMKIDIVGDDGSLTPMVEADFTRVENAPAEFLRSTSTPN